MTVKRLFVTICACIALIVVTAACNGAATPPQPEPTSEAAADDLTTYVGDVDGNLFIALDVIELNGAQEERAVRAYLCDGADVAVWLTGQFSGDQVTLVSGDTRVALTNMNSASGTLSLEGEAEVPFTTTLATGDAGLYRAEATFDGLDYIGGWIVLNDGQQRGAITMDGLVTENPTLDVASGQAETSVGTLSSVRCFINPFTGERICFRVN
jgi:hypothetical protein